MWFLMRGVGLLLDGVGIALFAFMVWLFVCLGVAMSISSSETASMNTPDPKDPKDPNKANSGGTTKSATNELADQLLNAVPDGTTVTYDQFRQSAGDKIADLLTWANPQKITRHGNHVILESAASASTNAGGVTINVANRVEFDVDFSSGDLKAKKIKGVTVSLGSGLPTLTLKEATLTQQPNGNTTIKGNLEVSWLLPYVPFEITVGPDGKPVP